MYHDMTAYQSAALRSEAAVNAALMGRFQACREIISLRFKYLQSVIRASWLDELKRHVFYGIPNKELPRPVPSSPPEERSLRMVRLAHAILGVATELDELISAYLDGMEGGRLDRVGTGEELGDVLWYVALAADALGLPLERVAALNVAKLQQRYPDQFSQHHAANRDLEAERRVLEQ